MPLDVSLGVSRYKGSQTLDLWHLIDLCVDDYKSCLTVNCEVSGYSVALAYLYATA